MATKLMGLQLQELSFVDRPANKAARVSIFKRDDTDETAEEEYWKRDFSAKEREHLAGTGAALPDGSFPIKNTHDLRNAIHLVGRASDPAKAKAHIISRAKTLGATSELPEDWTKSLTKVNKENDMDEIEKLKQQLADLTKSLETAVADNTAKAAKIDELEKAKGKVPPQFLRDKGNGSGDGDTEPDADDDTQKRFQAAVDIEVAKRMKVREEDEVIKIADPSDETKSIEISKAAVGEQVFAGYKALNAQIEKGKDALKMAELTKRAETEYGSLKGTAAEKAQVLKAMASMPEAVRKTLDDMLKSGNVGIRKTFTPIGIDGSGDGATDPIQKLEVMVSEFQKTNKVTKAKAYDEVLKTDEGKALYRESLGTPKAAA